MEYLATHFGKPYAPNSRETIRRETLHQFVQAGIVMYNPDDSARATNSPKAVYQIEPSFLQLVQTFGSRAWSITLKHYVGTQTSLVKRYANEREISLVSVRASEKKLVLSPGKHSVLIRAIIEEFAARFVPGAELIYVGDTGEKWAFFDQKRAKELNLSFDMHGKMPDVILFWAEKKWLVLAESVTSHGPINPKRRIELSELFAPSKIGIVFVTAFPDRITMNRFFKDIAWETEVWIQESPTHLIHFNGERFLGPYE